MCHSHYCNKISTLQKDGKRSQDPGLSCTKSLANQLTKNPSVLILILRSTVSKQCVRLNPRPVTASSTKSFSIVELICYLVQSFQDVTDNAHYSNKFFHGSGFCIKYSGLNHISMQDDHAWPQASRRICDYVWPGLGLEDVLSVFSSRGNSVSYFFCDESLDYG